MLGLDASALYADEVVFPSCVLRLSSRHDLPSASLPEM